MKACLTASQPVDSKTKWQSLVKEAWGVFFSGAVNTETINGCQVTGTKVNVFLTSPTMKSAGRSLLRGGNLARRYSSTEQDTSCLLLRTRTQGSGYCLVSDDVEANSPAYPSIFY